MRGKPKIYLESSVINMFFQDDAPYLRDLTRQFWGNVLPHFDGYVSEVVLAEIRATEDVALRKALETLIKGFKILEITEGIVKLGCLRQRLLSSPLESGVGGVLWQTYTPLYPLFLEGKHTRLKFLYN